MHRLDDAGQADALQQPAQRLSEGSPPAVRDTTA
jgi:hypothetical protein